ncbi:MAG: DUF5995 family protein [Jatrophihabitans sp.]
MLPAVPPPEAPATTFDDVIGRLKTIEAALPASDGVACFNRMYLEVTLGVHEQVQRGTYGDPNWVSMLDVVFANYYFAAIDSLSGPPSDQPTAWRPLLAARDNRGIEPIQFALAGMNVHINHDLPLAVVETCSALSTAPAVSPHRDDYQKIDKLLDAAEQSVRESFEPPDIRLADHHVASVTNLICNWSLNEARDIAWDTALAIWAVRAHSRETQLLTDALARIVALGTRTLLVAV